MTQESNPAADASKPVEPEWIDIADFARLDLRVARVLAVEPHPNADRLLKLRIDLGGEERQLVAGLAEFYKPEDLEGRSIVVLANLKPAKLRGEISQGMLLAAAHGAIVSILTPDQAVPPGSRIR